MFNYKRLLPNQEYRLRLLGLVDFVPDRIMIKLQYWIKTGRKLELKNPKRFTEKLQWYKLNYRKDIMTECADKFMVRDHIIKKDLGEILIPNYGVYSNAEQIDFDKLPKEFILKTTNGSGTNIICNNKSKLDEENTKSILNSWLEKRTSKAGREWPYYNIKPQIICEKLLEKDENNDLIDYKFVTFNGKVEYVFVNAERDSSNEMQFGIYDSEFNQLPYTRKGLRNTDDKIKKPKNYSEMVRISEKLAIDFPHVRVDLYNIKGAIYFGEMTFFHGSGYVDFEPDEFDYLLGKKFDYPGFGLKK